MKIPIILFKKVINKIFDNPQYIFLIISFVIGVSCIFIIPLGRGYDELFHIKRVWEVSGGTFIPNYLADKVNNFPVTLENLIKIPVFEDNSINQFWKIDWSEKIDWWQMTSGSTSSSYFPTLYLPQALIMGFFGRNFNIPPAILLYLVRFTCLLSFIIPTYFSIKIIPFSKWLFTGLTLVPMALLQSSTISTDGISNGFSFFFIAWMLAFSYREEQKIDKTQFTKILVLSALLFSFKLNLIILIMLLLLIPKDRFSSKSQMILLIGLEITFFIIFVLGWNYLTRSSLPNNNGNTARAVFNQMIFIAFKPLSYIKILLEDLRLNFGYYIQTWIATFPMQNLRMPWLIHAIYLAAIIFLVFLDPSTQPLGKKRRLFLALIGIIGYLFTITLVFIKDSPIGAKTIVKMSGRYLITLLPLILLSVTVKVRQIPPRIFKSITISLLSIVPILFCGALILRYNVTCGLNYLSGKECVKPVYRNWAPNSQYSKPLVPGVVVKQTFLASCNNLEMLSLWVDHQNNDDFGTTSIIIRELASGDIVTERKFTNALMPKKNWLTFSFPRVEDSKNQKILIEVFSQDTKPENAITLSLSYRQEYLDGELAINDSSLDTDLIFQYGCSVNP